MEGERVTVCVPLVGDFPPSVYDPKGRFIGFIYENAGVHPLDIDGARTSSVFEKWRREGIRDLARQAPPADLSAYQQLFLEHNPPPMPQQGRPVRLPDQRGNAVLARQTSASRGSRCLN